MNRAATIHRKAPVLESLFNKVACLKACNFIKKRLQHWCFLVDIGKNICMYICMYIFQLLTQKHAITDQRYTPQKLDTQTGKFY